MNKFTKQLQPKYDHKQVEDGKYEYWLKNGFFKSGDISKKPYSIVIPPPNVTGKLHLGHAWNTTIQDIIIRQKRMSGYDVLWLPGMDHAGIATQAKIDAALKEKGTNRYELGREAFLKVAWQWKEEYGQFIHNQWAALGLSLDYSKERFTLDKGLNDAVNHVFVTMYNEGLLYRDEKIINWDIQSKTALSNIEVEYKEIEGAFYYFKYPFTDDEGGLIIATTRPETMFGDTALMVHPDDDRYQKYIGKTVYIPGTKRKIPVISDEYVDRDFGSGVVKVTPAHDPNDFEVGNRHNLPRIVCMNEDGTMNEWAEEYEGMDRFVCREALLKKLSNEGYLIKTEKLIHDVGHSERTGVIVEPRLSLQWFVRMDKLAKDVLDMQASSDRIEIIPERFNKTFSNWLENTQDWCISRQLWWGHQIPAWYKENEVYVGVTSPGEDWVRDEDVLDTWFSSALWPFSTLNWPVNNELLDRYFPTSCLVTAYDIIFFWVARMAFQSKHFMNKRPFEKCLIHGLIRDEKGRKMSKSLGNGVDPFDLIDKYGCDALRYFLTTNSTPGQDLRYSEEKIASSWNYINKIWNISRYIQMNLNNNNYNDESINYELLSDIDLWIIKRFNEVLQFVNNGYDKFEFGEIAKIIYNFVWDDFASWYLELTKVVFNNPETPKEKIINTCAVLKEILINILKLLHPFMPFMTEEIYQIFEDGSIMVSSWPNEFNYRISETTTNNVDLLIDIITNVRNIRNENKVPMSKPINLIFETTNENIVVFLNEYQDYLKRFTNFDKLNITSGANIEDAHIIILHELKILIPQAGLINYEEVLAKLLKDQEYFILQIERSENMLNNPVFIQKAPTAKVEYEKQNLQKAKAQLSETQQLIAKIKDDKYVQ